MPGPPKTVLGRLLRHLARPARRDPGAEGLVLETFRGYGNGRELYFIGRVLRQPGGPVASSTGNLWASLRRLFRRGAAGETVTATFAGAQQRAVTDGNGYFRVHLRAAAAAPSGWQRVMVNLDLPSGAVASAATHVFVPPRQAGFVVISDIDDTVMFTGVAQRLRMLWRLFARSAESRVAFPGVGALYRALHANQNPMLYVSRAPWSLYGTLETFFRYHRIPVGPVLFLRDWGLSRSRLLPRRGRGHKLALIRDMLAVYDDLPFVLIGDSGQHDPETYAQVVREHPGRVAAIYIRNVSRAPRRRSAIETLAEEVLEAGASLLLASDSVAMAEHAAEKGLIPHGAVEAVARERQLASPRQSRRRRLALRRGSRSETRKAVARGELADVLEQDDGLQTADELPPSTVVESDRQDGRIGRSS